MDNYLTVYKILKLKIHQSQNLLDTSSEEISCDARKVMISELCQNIKDIEVTFSELIYELHKIEDECENDSKLMEVHESQIEKAAETLMEGLDMKTLLKLKIERLKEMNAIEKKKETIDIVTEIYIKFKFIGFV